MLQIQETPDEGQIGDWVRIVPSQVGEQVRLPGPLTVLGDEVARIDVDPRTTALQQLY